jgi:hypothetical protein
MRAYEHCMTARDIRELLAADARPSFWQRVVARVGGWL